MSKQSQWLACTCTCVGYVSSQEVHVSLISMTKLCTRVQWNPSNQDTWTPLLLMEACHLKHPRTLVNPCNDLAKCTVELCRHVHVQSAIDQLQYGSSGCRDADMYMCTWGLTRTVGSLGEAHRVKVCSTHIRGYGSWKGSTRGTLVLHNSHNIDTG